jgi:hypothetical protein
MRRQNRGLGLANGVHHSDVGRLCCIGTHSPAQLINQFVDYFWLVSNGQTARKDPAVRLLKVVERPYQLIMQELYGDLFPRMEFRLQKFE